jgi:hypothetical protein
LARPDAVVVECAFDSNPDDAIADQVWTDISPYVDMQAGVKITRGRQDEFSDIQPSKLTLTLDNRDGRFTPENTASPYYPNVVTGKRIRLGLLRKGNGKQMWPTDPSFEGDVASFPFGATGTTPPTLTQSSAQAFDGTNSMLITWPTAASRASQAVSNVVSGFIAGRQYTASVRVFVPAGSPQVAFKRFGVLVLSTTTGTGSWEQLSITWTAAASSEKFTLWNEGAATAGQQAFVDAIQIEEGSTATAFEPEPGVFSWRFTGDVNEWPLAWQGGGAFYAQSKVTATDRFKRLGDLGELGTTLDEDILDDVPFAYYPLNEPAGVAGSTASAGDISGNDESPLILRQVGSGGTVTFGSTPGVPDFYIDRRTTVAINPTSEGNGAYLRATLKQNPAVLLPAGSAVSVIAMESVSPLDTGPLVILTGIDGSWFGVNKRTNGNITASFYNAATDTLTEVDSAVGLSNTRPHLYTAVLDVPSAGDGRITFYIDGIPFGAAETFTMAAVPTWRVVSVGGRAADLFRGYLSHAAFFNWAVSAAAIAGWWTSAFKGTDGAGSTSYSRLDKLCVYTKLESPLFFQSFNNVFNPQSVGPLEIEGEPLKAMRLVEDTEGGSFLIRGDGTSLFRLRNYRFNRTPSITFTADQLDPDATGFRGDDFGLVNDVTASRPDGASARIANATSVAMSGRRKASIDAIPTTDDALRAIAAWEANAYGTQRNRVTGLKVSLLNDESLIAGVLTLDISDKVAVTGLPGQAPSASTELFVEGWEEIISEEDWSVAFNTSPGAVGDVWQIGVAGHSEIGTTTRIGY